MINDLIEEDIEEVLLMSDKLVGENFQTYNSIKTFLSDSKKILKVYKVRGKIIGFAKGEILEKAQFKKSLLKTNATIEDKLDGLGSVGFAETICVKEEYRGKHIAHKLADELIHSFREINNIDAICTTVWKTKEGANAKNLVERIGFKYVTEIEEYWYNDSLALNYKCPKCGKPPCKCSMVFYKLS